MNAKTALAIAAGVLILSGSAFASSSLLSSLTTSDASGNGDGSLPQFPDPTDGQTLMDSPENLSDEIGGLFSMQLSASQIAQYASIAGFTQPDLATAVAIALAESGGNPGAYNPETAAGTPEGKGSYGLWQVYLKVHPQYTPDQLRDPQENAIAAFDIYRAAGGFHSWSTFKNGAYLAHLESVNAEIGDVFV